jgi:pyruvate carboxylase
MDALSGNTSQPCLGSIVEALKGSERDPGLDPEWIRRISFYWEAVRFQYAAFESDLKGRPRRSISTKCPAASSPT